jgi:hypothetical protein
MDIWCLVKNFVNGLNPQHKDLLSEKSTVIVKTHCDYYSE